MKKQIKHVNRFFWAWQEAKEMAWLQQMSQDGWHLTKVFKLLIGSYTFQKGEPKAVTYSTDFRIIRERDVNEYLALFRDAGWTLTCRLGSIFYFSAPSENQTKEIYTDNHSLLDKYRLLLGAHMFVFLLLMNFLRMESNRLNENNLIISIPQILIFLVGIPTWYSFVQILRLVIKLSRAHKE